MRRILTLAVVLMLAAGGLSYGQNQSQSITGRLSSATCPGTGCVTLSVTGVGGIGLQITGTFSGTVSFEGSIDGVTYIAGANQSEYNGTYTITRIDEDSFSYTFAGSATTPATGTITAQGGTLRGVRVIGASVSANALKTTGAASGKKVVCVDTSTGTLYASSTATDCSN